MPRYAAFLRGINVGGHRVTSGELRSVLGEIGLAEVATFRASGNVIFSAEGRERPDKIASRVEEALSESLGYAVPTFVRTEREVRAIAELEPFEAELVGASAGKLQVALLAAEPSAQVRKKALSIGSDEDRLSLDKRELYWLPSGRLTDSALDLDALAALLGPTTMRTKNTIDQIAAKHFAG